MTVDVFDNSQELALLGRAKLCHRGEMNANRQLLMILTATTVLSVGNVYYSQPLLGEMAAAFRKTPAEVGFIPTLTQLGYVVGLFLVVPLGDVQEQRRLLTLLLLAASLVLLGCALAPTFSIFAVLAFFVGVTAVLVQIIIPFVAVLSPPKERGRNLGVVLSAALIGVLISRTLSGFIGAQLGWRAVYFIASGVMLILGIGLRLALPVHEPTTRLRYPELLKSLIHLFLRLRKVRAIAMNGALIYAALSAFWASLAFYLHSDTYQLGPRTAGLFGLVGAVGALAANVAGRHAERVGPRKIVHFCIALMVIAYLTMAFVGNTLIGLIAGTILLDLGAQATTVSNQTQLYSLHAEAQTRLNTIYKMFYFVGGAVGSATSAICWQHFGWIGVCGAGIAFLIAAALWERIEIL